VPVKSPSSHLALLFHELDAQEAEPAQQRNRQQSHEPFRLTELAAGATEAAMVKLLKMSTRVFHRAQRLREVQVRVGEDVRMPGPIHGIRAEQSREEEDSPWSRTARSQLARIELLLGSLEMVSQMLRVLVRTAVGKATSVIGESLLCAMSGRWGCRSGHSVHALVSAQFQIQHQVGVVIGTPHRWRRGEIVVRRRRTAHPLQCGATPRVGGRAPAAAAASRIR